MQIEQYKEISHLNGLPFIEALLKLEERRFSKKQFLKGSTFEDINADFGIFPKMAAYPVYFAGDITKPKNKFVFMGINPGFNEEGNRKEQAFLQNKGSFDGYCRLFGDFRFERKKGLMSYFANIAGFLRRLYNINEPMDWDWFQEHFIMLDLIPYHSVNSSGLRINDPQKFRDVYFEINLKLLKHINPKRPIFINGFPTYKKFMEDKKGELLPQFKGVIEYKKYGNIVSGTIGKRFKFVGLPFLNRPRGGVDSVVKATKKVLG